MKQGYDFLVAQVNNACMQYEAFARSLRDHAAQADDERFRQLCLDTLPDADDCLRSMESYRDTLGRTSGGELKRTIGIVAGAVRDLADAPRTGDFLRLAGDIVMARQAEDTFRTFREAGRRLGNDVLARIGDKGEKIQDDYARQANRLCQDLFVEQARSTATEEMGASMAEAAGGPTV